MTTRKALSVSAFKLRSRRRRVLPELSGGITLLVIALVLGVFGPVAAAAGRVVEEIPSPELSATQAFLSQVSAEYFQRITYSCSIIQARRNLQVS